MTQRIHMVSHYVPVETPRAKYDRLRAEWERMELEIEAVEAIDPIACSALSSEHVALGLELEDVGNQLGWCATDATHRHRPGWPAPVPAALGCPLCLALKERFTTVLVAVQERAADLGPCRGRLHGIQADVSDLRDHVALYIATHEHSPAEVSADDVERALADL